MALGADGRLLLCPRCGSRAMHTQRPGEGLWPGGGEGVAWVCPDCHFIGAPFLADHPDAAPTGDEAHWRQEYAAVAADLEAGRVAERPNLGPHALDVALVVLGGLFLLMSVAGILTTVAGGGPGSLLHALAANGWLLAIGLALVVIGSRRLRGGGTPATGDGSGPGPGRPRDDA